MATFQMVPVEALLEPLNPQREETLLERIDELRDSIRTNGLQQPIGVERTNENAYRIIWGHRRSIAVTQLGWSHVGAMVYEPGEADVDVLMGAENYQRANTSEKEEALYYKRILPKYPEGTIGMARELNVPQMRIERLLIIGEGDEKVFDALGRKEVSMAVAWEINKFKSPGYRAHALERAIKEGMSADSIRRWLKDLQAQGVDHSSADQTIQWKQPVAPVGNAQLVNCQIGNHMIPILDRKVYEICNVHYNIFLKGLEAVGREEVLQDAGLWRDFLRLMAQAEGVTADGSRSGYTSETEASLRVPLRDHNSEH